MLGNGYETIFLSDNGRIFSYRETNNSDLLFFWGALMIYGENVKVAKFLQSADLITEWVI